MTFFYEEFLIFTLKLSMLSTNNTINVLLLLMFLMLNLIIKIKHIKISSLYQINILSYKY